jgi:uncharacterized protein involved in exopolysaccharide biosynthesis
MEDNQNTNDNREENKKSIQYIPVNVQSSEYSDEDSIDISEIIKMFWDKRRFLLKFTLSFFIIGVLVILLSPDEYSSDVQLLPEEQTGFSIGSLGSLAQEFGFAPNPTSSSDGISANLFPSIIQSNVFLEELMSYRVTVPDSDQTISLKEYVMDHQRRSLVNNVMRYSILLPFTVWNWLNNDDEDINRISEMDRTLADRDKLDRLTRLSEQEWITLRMIRERITTNIDDETGIVSIHVKLQDPVIVAMVADEVVGMLSEYITENRTEKARRNFEFIQKRFQETKSRFEQAQQELAEFNDANRGQLTALARTEQQLLQSNYELNFNLYNSMAERLEEARIQLQEETPVINILEPAAVPDQQSEPRSLLILVLFVIAGGGIGLGLIIIRPSWDQLKRSIN